MEKDISLNQELRKENQIIIKAKGILLTIILAVLSKLLVTYPYLSIMGTMVLAILIGITWRSIFDVPESLSPGIDFTAKKILRYGIILMGIRLNFSKILESGYRVILLDILVIAFAITLIYTLGKLFNVQKNLSLLVGIGTGVCGAAAIAAVAPLIDADENETTISIAIIAILGTIFTILYTFLFPVLHLNPYVYGIFSGSTLHELGHVIAAATKGGSTSLDIAVIVKLGRVALLVPVAFIINVIFRNNIYKNSGAKKISVPWFIMGFLAFSLINTFNILPKPVVDIIIQVSIFLLTMAMAALGLNVRIASIKSIGLKVLLIGITGSIVISVFGYIFVNALY